MPIGNCVMAMLAACMDGTAPCDFRLTYCSRSDGIIFEATCNKSGLCLPRKGAPQVISSTKGADKLTINPKCHDVIQRVINEFEIYRNTTKFTRCMASGCKCEGSGAKL
jgi:hypothetical protein